MGWISLPAGARDLKRYFPEIEKAALALPETRFLLDGELVIQMADHFSFDDLLQRIHPAKGRIDKLAKASPALFLAFDLLGWGKKMSALEPMAMRRPQLKEFARRSFGSSHSFRLSPVTCDVKQALRWLKAAGGGCDGVIAKRRDLIYQAGNRDGMQKIKRHRSADCVIGGFRYGEKKIGERLEVASLLLGLYDRRGKLNHVGFSSGIKADAKPALTERLEEMKSSSSFTGVTPGGPSRWSSKRSDKWQPIEPHLVIEVSYDHFTGGRFRHGTSIVRWRPDKSPRQCTMDQLEQKTTPPSKLLGLA